MKIQLTLLLVLCSIIVNAQSYFYPISKETFDSLNTNKYYGRVYLRNQTYLDGWIKKTPVNRFIKFKHNLNDKKYELFTAFKVEGFNLVSANLDTAWYVFQKVKSENYEWRPLRILIDGGPEGLHLLRYAWLTFSLTNINLFNSNTYQINWIYFMWKADKQELIEITSFNRDLKNNISSCKLALEYYKENKRKLVGDGNYTHLQNIIQIYNKHKEHEKEN